jgi:hypothetical protein
MLAVHHAHATPTATRGYARRQPEDTVLYGVVPDHVATLLDTARDHSEHGFVLSAIRRSRVREVSRLWPLVPRLHPHPV